MKSTHNTIRALAIGIGLTLLVVTGTAAMMAAFSSPAPATNIYRRVALVTPASDPVTHVATAHDSVLYERVILADGKVQWVLTGDKSQGPSMLVQPGSATARAGDTDNSGINVGNTAHVSYALSVKPAGLSKAVRTCSRSAYDAYDIACNTLG